MPDKKTSTAAGKGQGKIRDMKPRKDAKGGGVSSADGSVRPDARGIRNLEGAGSLDRTRNLDARGGSSAA
jgi:hypothetical protein